MRLLIFTQVLDTNHPILGFFHRWVQEFAVRCDSVIVICLQEGKHSLPDNVRVYSLGKDEGKGTLTYLYRFYKLIWSLRREYDQVFIHMNQVYVILGGMYWRLLRKEIGFWYAHGAVSTSLRLAVFIADMVFTSTEQGMQIVTPKRIIVGQGIDTDLFKDTEHKHNSPLQLITVGRISRLKNLDTLIRACGVLRKKNIPFQFKIIGITLSAADKKYEHELRSLAKSLDIATNVHWYGPVPNNQLPHLLQAADVFIHDGATNSLDKTLIEASLCGCVVISSNPAYAGITLSIAPELIYKVGQYEALAEIIEKLGRGNPESVQKVRDFFSKNYSITNLISGILTQYKNTTDNDGTI